MSEMNVLGQPRFLPFFRRFSQSLVIRKGVANGAGTANVLPWFLVEFVLLNL